MVSGTARIYGHPAPADVFGLRVYACGLAFRLKEVPARASTSDRSRSIRRQDDGSATC
jgi:hypothetical protein